MPKNAEALPVGSVRLDKWLWAARFFKTRQVAIDAIHAGRVDVNGERAKPAKAVKAGDALSLRKPPYAFHLQVLGVAEKRGPASAARHLSLENAQTVEAGERLAVELREMPAPIFTGRPTKRDRREIERFERSANEDGN